MIMTYRSRAFVMILGFAFTAGAAVTAPKEQYQSARRYLAMKVDASTQACQSLPQSSVGLCRAEADREYHVASARLDALYSPSVDGSYKARIAIANADYMVARRKCDEKQRDVKRFCLRQARTEQIAAKAVANAPEDTSVMKRAFDRKVDAARKQMRDEEERTEGRKDSASAKRNTELHISVEQCDTLPNSGRLDCVEEAVRRFGPL